MRKRKYKNTGITLIALVITIVIMLLLAGVALQIAMGENGLIAKSVQAQKEQAKAELYETAKLSYATLNVKALENGQPSPQVELALSTTQFRDRYDIVGDDITDKNGNVIDTKANVLNVIQGTVAGGFSSGTSTGTTTPAVYKTVGGVQILEDDKDKMILKLKILRESKTDIVMPVGVGTNDDDPETAVNIDFGNGIKREVTNLYSGESMEYAPGEYIVKIDRIRTISIKNYLDSEVEILQWGKIRIDTTSSYGNVLEISNVSKIYEPEPDKIVVEYKNPLFKEIPEWLFSKKITSEVMSKFVDVPYSNGSPKIEKIPEDLFKNCINAKDFSEIFVGCKKIKEIPENLFKYNVNATNFNWVFYNCTGLTSIPEGLFENNVNVKNIRGAFMDCTGITSIPEKIIELAKQVKNNGGRVYSIFAGCISASNYNSMPDYMKQYH